MAKSLYRSVGFEETGLFENGMEELRLKCQKNGEKSWEYTEEGT